MRAIHLRVVAAAAAVVALAAGAAAQEKNTPLLNTIELQQLVTRAEPGDHVQLAAHFQALAERYAGESRRHAAMARSFSGHPSRSQGTGMSQHCKQLADLNTESAGIVGELAAYHQKLAGGVAATPPRGGSRFQAGAGAREPSDKELAALAARADSPADHRALEEYFQTLAKRYTTQAGEHGTLAQTYRGTRIAQAAAHHDRLAALARNSAKEATAAAEVHRGLAGITR